MTPAISVTICVRNGARTIERQLQALDAQEAPPPFEIIICDNGSTDGTDAVVRNWMDCGNHQATSIRLIDGGRKPSIPRCRNIAVMAAKADVVAFCDADDEVQPGWLRALTEGVPKGGMAGGRIRAVSPDGEPQADTFQEGLQHHGFLPFAPNGNMAASRDLLVELRGYDESLPRYGFEDVDLSWRAQLSGRDVLFVPDAVITMTLSANRRSLRKRFLLGQGRVLMAHRYPGYDARRYSVALCLRDIASSTLRLGRSFLRQDPLPPRRSASLLIESAGRLYGCLRYSVFGHFPEPKLTTPVTATSATVVPSTDIEDA